MTDLKNTIENAWEDRGLLKESVTQKPFEK